MSINFVDIVRLILFENTRIYLYYAKIKFRKLKKIDREIVIYSHILKILTVLILVVYL